jgi:hypothetical protein
VIKTQRVVAVAFSASCVNINARNFTPLMPVAAVA